MAKKLSWHTERRRVRDLVPAEKNPNVENDSEFKKLKENIKKLGYVEIIVADTDGRIAAGNHRWKALMELDMGDAEIDVRVPDRKLTKEEFDRYLISSNSLHGSFDFEVLREYDPDLLLQILNDTDLSHAFDDVLETEDDGFDEEAAIAEIKEPTVKRGDCLALGNHVLACIDSTDQAAVRKLVGKEKIALSDIDPPFSIGLRYSGKNNKYGGAERDDRSPEEYRAFIKSLIENAKAVSAKDAHFLMWCDERFVWLLQQLYAECGVKSQRLCLWVKNGVYPTEDIAFGKATEFACYGTTGSPFLNDRIRGLSTILNKEVGNGNRTIEDIIDLFNVWLVKRLPGDEYMHPTQKSPTLHEKILRRCTKPGDAVLDLTTGSGSLMIACEQMKRRAFLAEVDPIFATLIKNRYEQATGNKARKLN